MACGTTSAYDRLVTEIAAEPALSIRTLTEQDLPAFAGVMAKAFLAEDDAVMREHEGMVFEPERAYGVFDGDRMIGTGMIMTRTMTLPGVGQSPVAAVTSVAVTPGDRRRGALTTIMRAQLHGLHETGGEPVAVLWASESVIYGRFGYGLASHHLRASVAKGTAYRPGVPVSTDRVCEVPEAEALEHVKAVQHREAAMRVGALGRSERAWNFTLFDPPAMRQGMSGQRFAVHPDGYAIYRVKADWRDTGPHGVLSVREIVATTPAAYATLFRHLLDYDLIGEIRFAGAVDEPILHLVASTSAVTGSLVPALWVRLVDVDRALETRRYSAPLDVVLEVTDAHCPWNAGTWRLTVDGSGNGHVQRADLAPQLALDIADLGAAYLGGTRLSTLAAAGRVRELAHGALGATTRAMLTDRPPACLEVF